METKFSSFLLAGNIIWQFNYRKSRHVTSRCHNPQFIEWNYAVMPPGHSVTLLATIKRNVFVLQINSNFLFIILLSSNSEEQLRVFYPKY